MITQIREILQSDNVSFAELAREVPGFVAPPGIARARRALLARTRVE